MAYNFEKQGIKFSLRNPTWENNGLNFEWKIIGIKENNQNDGYYYHCVFNLDKKAIIFPAPVVINGEHFTGVILPDKLLKIIEFMYYEFKEKALIEEKRKLYADIKYTLNDTDAYGIYNGISEFDIANIVLDIAKKLNVRIYISPSEVAQILNRDEELKQIAKETYRPNPEQKNWNDEYRTWFRQAVTEKKAPGYGIIPNEIIRKKIRYIICNKIEEENKRMLEKENKEKYLLETAKRTGIKQLISKWTENCNSNGECIFDICYLWVMPDGTKEIERYHTY